VEKCENLLELGGGKPENCSSVIGRQGIPDTLGCRLATDLTPEKLSLSRRPQPSGATLKKND
jgi:hypothetical protein